ncbi:lasso peptide biosynthesis B2 protein [Amycolatopsis umgeniensis]|uniref:lasso peptide biosynthesis B2 protein n=1 Tax=Amycolatopsis umgeniensis TaxID=336628 RepID=UPI001C88A853
MAGAEIAFAHRSGAVAAATRRPPPTYEQARAARNDVVATSDQCNGEGCLQRSLATVMLCRLRGRWPTWCTGVRTHPFSAHAWVQAGDRPVDEPHPDQYYRPLLTVTPILKASAGRRDHLGLQRPRFAPCRKLAAALRTRP